MIRQRNYITERPILSDLNNGNIVTGTNAGVVLYVPKYKLYNIKSQFTYVFEVIEKGTSYWKSWFNRFGTANDRKFMARWLGH